MPHGLDTVLNVFSDHLLENGVNRRWNFIPLVAERWDGLLAVGQEALHGRAPFVHGASGEDAE